MIGGLACAAVALGLAAGFVLKPDPQALSTDRAEAQVRKPVPIEVTQPQPPSPPPRPAGKLEVLDPATAEDARGAQPASAPTIITPRDPLAACAGSRSRAEALVCADPQLAGYERDLARAYRRALRSGAVDPADLRADQRDWLDVREDAGRRSPRAMAEVYSERIDELNRIADDGPGDSEP